MTVGTVDPSYSTKWVRSMSGFTINMPCWQAPSVTVNAMIKLVADLADKSSHRACRKDKNWHHVAVTWSFATGKTEVFFDGTPHLPTWKTSAGHWQSKAAKDGGVDPSMAAQTLRLGNGASTMLQTPAETFGIRC